MKRPNGRTSWVMGEQLGVRVQELLRGQEIFGSNHARLEGAKLGYDGTKSRENHSVHFVPHFNLGMEIAQNR